MEHGSFLDDEDDDPTIQNGHVPSIGYTYIYIYIYMDSHDTYIYGQS